jgi:hypothetical protein
MRGFLSKYIPLPSVILSQRLDQFLGSRPPGSVECTIEWVDGHNATVRMHIKGAGLSELTALAGVLRSGRT